jgi:butyrate kinase
MLVGKGGIASYLGTNNMIEVDKRIEAGDEEAKLVMDAFVFQLSKDIGSAATALYGKVDQIILTGGIAYSEMITNEIKERVSFIAPVEVYPGENELESLAENGYGILAGEFEIKEYILPVEE